MGVLRPIHQSRRPRVLRPAPRGREHPPSSTPRPRQPSRGHLARLPEPPQNLRRKHRLGPPHSRRGLTTYHRGMSRTVRWCTIYTSTTFSNPPPVPLFLSTAIALVSLGQHRYLAYSRVTLGQ